MPQNTGEKNEIFLKAFLLMSFKKQMPLEGVHGIGLITSLKFSSDGNIPEWKPIYADYLKNRNYDALKKIFPKAPTGSKADLEINGIKYSVKNSQGARSAIVNHTSRRGFLRILKLLKIDIGPLDRMIDEYWKKRINNEIKEDIDNESDNSPFVNHKEYLKPIIEYFLFKGSGSRESSFPADKVLIFNEPDNSMSYMILSKAEALDFIWPFLVFSVRSKKGMPTKKDKQGNITSEYRLPEHSDLAPWVRFYPEGTKFPKGALHIRS